MKAKCLREGCERESISRGHCHMHYKTMIRREQREGTWVPVNSATLFERFQSKFVELGVDECWEWTGSCNKWGYGQLQIDGSAVGAHRVSYELYNGKIPDGLLVRHKCDNRPCVNPGHLEVGTHLDNAHDRDERGRSGCTKLTVEIVNALRAEFAGESPRTNSEVARSLNVSQSTISQMRSGATWKPSIRQGIAA